MENLNLQEIKKRLAEAWEEEERDLTKQRELARQMKGDLHKLVEYSASAVAFVAADGGDNRIRLDTGTGGAPATVELVRTLILTVENARWMRLPDRWMMNFLKILV